MTILKTKQVLNNLLKKGFHKSENDHTYLVLYVENKKTSIRTKISHGGKEIGDSLIILMSKQLKIDKKYFMDLVSCTKNGDEYVRELERLGIKFNHS